MTSMARDPADFVDHASGMPERDDMRGANQGTYFLDRVSRLHERAGWLAHLHALAQLCRGTQLALAWRMGGKKKVAHPQSHICGGTIARTRPYVRT